jgi:hypothetical protein
VPIDTSVPYTDGWWLQRLYEQLRRQRADCQKLWDRYEGNPPLPVVNNNQREAVKWFYGQSRTNFERLIVAAVLSRLRIRGIRTAVDNDEGGDAEAFDAWKRSRGKLWSLEVHKYALAMRKGYVIVGKDEQGRLLVTAEDPRQVTAIVDPADPTKVLAALKLYYDDARMQDVAYLFLPGRVMVAKRDRWVSAPTLGNIFHADAFYWSVDLLDEEGFLVESGESTEPEWLQATGDMPALCPVVVFENDDLMAEFEPYLPLLDRINQQVLQRMTIATVQAFKQRAMKGLPRTDPKTGEEINYDEIFVADPGAIWNIPASVDIWESGEVNLQPILQAIRDDVKDLAAISGTPLYTVTPDAAQGSAEGASLQRETVTFKVEAKQDRWELSHEAVVELMFRTLGDNGRAKPGTAQIMWAPADRPSMSERANAIAQTKGVIPRYIQMTEIWGLDPAEAERALEELEKEQKADAALGLKQAQPAEGRATAPAAGERPVQPREQGPAQ